MDHIISNFGNINYKTELELKVSLLEKENFELRGQIIDKMLITKQLRTNSKSYPFTTDTSTLPTNTITTAAQTYDSINSNNDNNNNNKNNNNSINNNKCKNKNNNNNKNNKIRNTKKTIALMKMQFTTKSSKHNCWKFERKHIKMF